MGLTIELSFSVDKNSNLTSIKQLLSNLAEKNNSNNHYFIHEIEGHHTIIDRNDCINIVEFEHTDAKNIINYIKTITKLKFLKIDCIYIEKGIVNLIYASKKYLLSTHKSSIKNPSKTSPISPISSKKIIDLVSDYFIQSGGHPHTPHV